MVSEVRGSVERVRRDRHERIGMCKWRRDLKGSTWLQWVDEVPQETDALFTYNIMELPMMS